MEILRLQAELKRVQQQESMLSTLTVDNDQLSKHLESIREETKQAVSTHTKELEIMETRNCKLLE